MSYTGAVELPPGLQAKVEGDLAERLKSSGPDEWVRVLARVTSAGRPDDALRRRPAAAQTREEFRRQLIEERQRQVKSSGRPEFLDRLRERGVSVSHGEMTDSVVIEGPSGKVAQVLQLDEIEHASLDSRLSLR